MKRPDYEIAAEEFNTLATSMRLEVESTFIPFSQSRNAKPRHGAKEPWESLNWRCHVFRKSLDGTKIPILECDYSQGTAHAPAYKQKFACEGDKRLAIRHQIETGKQVSPSTNGHNGFFPSSKPIEQPSFVDVLSSIMRDADVIEYATFEEWADSLGFDPDSRNAESAYRECLAAALAMRAALGESTFSKLRDLASQM